MVRRTVERVPVELRCRGTIELPFRDGATLDCRAIQPVGRFQALPNGAPNVACAAWTPPPARDESHSISGILTMTNATNPRLRTFLPVVPESHFPIQNLPFGVFRLRRG